MILYVQQQPSLFKTDCSLADQTKTQVLCRHFFVWAVLLVSCPVKLRILFDDRASRCIVFLCVGGEHRDCWCWMLKVSFTFTHENKFAYQNEACVHCIVTHSGREKTVDEISKLSSTCRFHYSTKYKTTKNYSNVYWPMHRTRIIFCQRLSPEKR